jgi:hypothetical protein
LIGNPDGIDGILLSFSVIGCEFNTGITVGELDFVFISISEVPTEQSLKVGRTKVGVEKLVSFYNTKELGLYCILYSSGSTIGLVFGC